jgi:hypothetical protein
VPIEITKMAKQAFSNKGLLNFITKSTKTIIEKKKTAKYSDFTKSITKLHYM